MIRSHVRLLAFSAALVGTSAHADDGPRDAPPPLAPVNGHAFDYAPLTKHIGHRTDVGLTWVPRSFSVSAGRISLRTAAVGQEYDVAYHWGGLELNGAFHFAGAFGIDGDSIVETGTALFAGARLGLGIALRDDLDSDKENITGIKVTLRPTLEFDKGARMNVQPLVGQVAADPIPLLDTTNPQNRPVTDYVLFPFTRWRPGVGLSGALLAGGVWMQAFARVEAIVTSRNLWMNTGEPQVQHSGQITEHTYDSTYRLGVGVEGRLQELWLASQLQYVSTLVCLSACDTHLTRSSDVLMSVGAYWMPNDRHVQIGGMTGLDFGKVSDVDGYHNDISARSMSVSVTLLSRYLW